MISLLIGADVCPIERNLPLFKAGSANALFNDLLPDFQKAHLSIVNLECPLVADHTPIPKTGPTFGEDPKCIRALQDAGIKLISLANNHILDHGQQGLRSTIETCRNAGIPTVGAGENLSVARQIVVQQIGRVRVGILSMAEHEFSIATNTIGGANPLDLMDFVRNVNSRRKDFDYLVVLLHGAHEFQPITPRIQETCRFMIEMGANAVVVQHPHSLGGYENYRGGHIIYGQGALLMDEAVYRNLKSFHEGFLVKINISDDGKSTVEIIPFTQADPDPGARKMTPEQERQFRGWFQNRSESILDPSFVQKEWQEFCRSRKDGYVSSLLGLNGLLRKLNRNGRVVKLAYGPRRMLGVRNLVRCETHREALETIFADGL